MPKKPTTEQTQLSASTRIKLLNSIAISQKMKIVVFVKVKERVSKTHNNTGTAPIGGRSQQFVLGVRAQFARILAILQSARTDCKCEGGRAPNCSRGGKNITKQKEGDRGRIVRLER
jgi:hypothetical protein